MDMTPSGSLCVPTHSNYFDTCLETCSLELKTGTNVDDWQCTNVENWVSQVDHLINLGACSIPKSIDTSLEPLMERFGIACEFLEICYYFPGTSRYNCENDFYKNMLAFCAGQQCADNAEIL